MTEQPRKSRRQVDKELDKALEHSFPASDPPSVIQPMPDHDEDGRNAPALTGDGKSAARRIDRRH